MMKHLLITLLITLFLNACFLTPPSRNYDEQPKNVSKLNTDALNIDLIKPISLNINPTMVWQNSGVFVEKSNIVTVTASGKWSPAPLAWSGPEGNQLWSVEVPGITGGALMAKLGHKGHPFMIGLTQTFKANDYGMLYFTINDPFRFLYDNEGQVTAKIYSAGDNSGKNSTVSSDIKILSYQYDNKTSKGTLSAKIGNRAFATRQYLVNKIGEIASSKNIAIKAGNAPVEGGSFELLDESSNNGVMQIHFRTLW